MDDSFDFNNVSSFEKFILPIIRKSWLKIPEPSIQEEGDKDIRDLAEGVINHAHEVFDNLKDCKCLKCEEK